MNEKNNGSTKPMVPARKASAMVPARKEAPIRHPNMGSSAFNLLTNSVTNADSAKLQKASYLPGRLGGKVTPGFV